MDILKVLLEFIITFIIVYAFYYFFIIKKCKKNKKTVPAEVNIILSLYQIDYKKIDILKMTKVVSLVTTAIIAIIVTLIDTFFNSTIIVLLFGTILSVVVAIICYRMIGKHYKKISDSKNNQK